MKRGWYSRESRKWLGMAIVMSIFALSGCFPKAAPLATLPIAQPEAAALNVKGIDQYHVGEWEGALQLFQSAIEVNPLLVEAHFNAGLALHQLERHQEASRYFQQAGMLDPENQSVVGSILYRNHLGLSSTLERHMSGGYRYHVIGQKMGEESEMDKDKKSAD
jgi:tetratricopeptide (TPR) repeat protein